MHTVAAAWSTLDKLLAKLSPTASLVSLIISVWAIRLARQQTTDARKQSDRAEELFKVQSDLSKDQSHRSEKLFKEQSDLIGELERFISTRSKGVFPNYLSEVARLLLEARKSIQILTLISSHGSYTAENEWLKVRHAIETQAADRGKITCELVTSNKAAFLETFRQIHPLFRRQANWDTWKLEEELNHNQRLSRFLQRSNLGGSADDLTTAELYYNARFQEHENVLRDVYERFGFTVSYCPLTLPLYCWLVDSNKAIFSLPTQDSSGRFAGTAVYTEDHNVIIALQRLFEHYRTIQ